eukprot:UN14176
MLGHLGTDYLSGVALASVWTSSTFCLALGVFSPLEMFTSQSLGAKQYRLMFAWLQIGLIILTLIGNFIVKIKRSSNCLRIDRCCFVVVYTTIFVTIRI